MRFLEAPNPLWLKIRPGEEPKTDIELMQVMAGMVRTAEFFDRAKPEGAVLQVVKCDINDIPVVAISKTDVGEMFKEYWRAHNVPRPA